MEQPINLRDPKLPTSPLHLNYLMLAACTVILAGIVHGTLKYLHAQSQRKASSQFKFMKLPPELRYNIYQYLLEPPEAKPSNSIASLDWYTTFTLALAGILHVAPEALPSFLRPRAKPQITFNHLNNLSLVSKQFGTEFMSVYLKMASTTFTLDASSTPADPPFRISGESLQHIRHCRLNILATPGIVGAFDPRLARSGNWALRDSVFAAMRRMTELKTMTLSIQACGNQLWNPLWLWHFTSQAFKDSDVKAFGRIDFTMKGWSLREPNHLARQRDGKDWEWRCREDHFVMGDDCGEQAVRDFCASLYAECQICEGGEPAAGNEV